VVELEVEEQVLKVVQEQQPLVQLTLEVVEVELVELVHQEQVDQVDQVLSLQEDQLVELILLHHQVVHQQ
tara:strand:+ start:271 stop:480 length:210 start_codon:yes stop_codon:yes gene_type:complete